MLQVCNDVPFQNCKDKEECHDVTKDECTKIPYKKCYVIYNQDDCYDADGGKKVRIWKRDGLA